jgi:hypothetical protein
MTCRSGDGLYQDRNESLFLIKADPAASNGPPCGREGCRTGLPSAVASCRAFRWRRSALIPLDRPLLRVGNCRKKQLRIQ